MKKILIIVLGVLFNYSYSQNLTNTENYIYKKTYLSDASDPVQKQLEEVQYLDGLGRPKQVISVKSTPSKQDMVLPIVYDLFGRKTKDYLPVPVQSSNGGIQTSVTESTVNSYYGVTNAFSEKEVESSPLSRIFQSASPGEEWKMNSGNTIKYAYDANSTADQVKKYKITTTWDDTNQIYNSTLSQIIYYDENSLYKFSVKDEDNNEKIVFKDLYGHIILIRKNDGVNNVDTYYVYDSNDHLSYVIPPLASVASILTTTMLDNLCYQYRYDNKNRLVEKKNPGKGLEYMVYDKQNRLVLSQDAVLRTVNNNFLKKGWLFTKYDQFGRAVYSGFFANTASRTAMQAALNNMSSLNNENRSTTPFILNGMDVYYTKDAFPTGSMTILGVSYYDTYPALPAGVSIPSYIINPTQSVLTQDAQNSSRSTKSLPTASYVKNIEDDNWTKNYVWYDTKGRAIGFHSINHLGGYTKTESELDFSGSPKQTKTYHKRLEIDTEKVITENFEYDHLNRLKKHWHQVGGNLNELLAENTYNEISELVNKKIGGTGANAYQSVDYTYNIRGWLTGINNPNNLGNSLFGYEIKYHNPSNSINTSAKYNGNISELSWKTANGAILKRYKYKYDGLNRLNDAIYEEPSISIPVVNGYGESLTYDMNGNIKTLKRFSAMMNTPMIIDDLDYRTYDGNQLVKVIDVSNNNLGYPSGGNIISYDNNGNMINHLDKGIFGIKYNYLDLPNHILLEQDFSQEYANLKFLYRSDGVKLKKSYTYFNPRANFWLTNEFDYLDGFQYTGGFLQFVPTAEGYYDFAYNRYVYQYKDQVGNIRLSYYHNGNNINIDKEMNYYPFGMEYFGSNGTYPINQSYSYGFQEQEKQEETGWISFKWRNYDSSLGRFFNIDPLSEVYSYQSHYNFSENRVIDAREIEGLEAELLTDNNSDVSSESAASFDGKSYDGGVNSLTKWSDGLNGANIQNVNLGTFNASSNQNGSSSGFSWGNAGRIGVGFVPIVGSSLDIYEGVRDGNWVQTGIGVGGLALDIVTLGSGAIIKGGVKAIGTELVEEGIELATKDVVKSASKEIAEDGAKKSAAFVVDEAGEAVATSQSRMIEGFENAGFNKERARETAEIGDIYQVPTRHGNVNVRAMEGNAKNNKRSVFTDPKNGDYRKIGGGIFKGPQPKIKRIIGSHLEQTR